MQILDTIRASSLFHAVLICVVISIFCTCLVMFGSYTYLMSQFFRDQSELLKTNQSISAFVISGGYKFQLNSSYQYSNNHIHSIARLSNWGCYQLLNTVSYTNHDTISQHMMVGASRDYKNNTALYISDYDRPVKFSGVIKIQGDTYLPKGRIEYSYIDGVLGNRIKVEGNKYDSKERLPEIYFPETSFLDQKSVSLETLKSKSIYQPFSQQTLVIKLDPGTLLENMDFKGNIVLFSEGDITIGSSVVLTDVIIKGRSVKVTQGFKGSLQIMAEENVQIDQHVSLFYPSGILLNSKKDSSGVAIGQFSKIAGSILIDGEALFKKNRFFSLAENAEVMGDIYCNGISILKGKISGRLFSDRVGIIDESGFSDNILFNTEINYDAFPKFFVSGLIFRNNSFESKYEIVKIL